MNPSNAAPDVVIVGAARTPNGRFMGALRSQTAVDLGTAAIRGALGRAGIGAGEVDLVLMGTVLQAGLGQCPARQAAIGAGLGWNVPAWTVNRVCLSGLTAVIDAARMLRCGEASVAVAGGMESMSNTPHLLTGARSGYAYGAAELVDSLEHDGLSDAWSHESMGLDTDRRTAEYPASRAEQDAFAARSHRLAAAARESGLFDAEVVGVTVRERKAEVVVDRDEGIRPGTTPEILAGLRPAFTPEGSLTAGNASQLSDGGAAVVLTTRATAAARRWPVLATVRAAGQVAGPSPALAPQPANALRSALIRQGWTVDDLDLVEINEAFAAVAVHAARQLALPTAKLNIHGGAIALGHPIGQSGARLVAHAAHELRRRGTGRAAVALCGGTGQGDALLLEA
ncbi:MAG: acetyl-CoA C-acyltransferase [Dactylosporangium sp.]|nr:acetyl-CoA C-acyltransferase [Dactylosporangium sp.]NNJ60688.1 acetyl-CoA C-acyltransferase [Dactylosporangium sp.]